MRQSVKFLFIFMLMTNLGCNDHQGHSSSSNQLHESDGFDLKEDSLHHSSAVEQCKKCDSIYQAIPKDSSDFEKLYGYPFGTRQHEVQSDFEGFFICLDICYDYHQLVSIVKLGSEIKYDADGPAFLQYHITEYLRENKDKALLLYTEINCIDFNSHVKFLFEGIPEHHPFLVDLCSFLQSMKIESECKRKILSEYCK